MGRGRMGRGRMGRGRKIETGRERKDNGLMLLTRFLNFPLLLQLHPDSLSATRLTKNSFSLFHHSRLRCN